LFFEPIVLNTCLGDFGKDLTSASQIPGNKFTTFAVYKCARLLGE
jgi:hypothetical protein